MYRAVEAEEQVSFEFLERKVTLLESQLEAAVKLALDHVEKEVQTLKECAKHGEPCNAAVESTMEDLKKMMASNLDLQTQVGNLQIELALAQKEVLIARTEALVATAGQKPGPSDA